jgi:hypothetical protein
MIVCCFRLLAALAVHGTCILHGNDGRTVSLVCRESGSQGFRRLEAASMRDDAACLRFV